MNISKSKLGKNEFADISIADDCIYCFNIEYETYKQLQAICKLKEISVENYLKRIIEDEQIKYYSLSLTLEKKLDDELLNIKD